MDSEFLLVNAAAKKLVAAMQNLDTAYLLIDTAFDGNDPGYPYPNSVDARAWDYLDAIDEAKRIIGNRLNTWDEGEYDE